MKKTLVVLAAVAAMALWAGTATAGEYHVAGSLVCYDCHTTHYSMQHGYQGQPGPAPSTPTNDGFWLAPNGPNAFLLKGPANLICLQCHEGQTFAPDVVADNTNASPQNGRSAGAINELGMTGNYAEWKGHTLDSTTTPPGWNPAAVGLTSDPYTPSNGLECINCHIQHGSVTNYRNLQPRSGATVTYAIATTQNTTRDVWINIAPPYTAGSGNAATFNPYYATANIFYSRIDGTSGLTKKSNNMDTFCGRCHGNFHGGPLDTNIGGVVSGNGWAEFVRHPTGQVNIGALGGGHSQLAQFVAGTTKAKVYTNDYTSYASSSPGCVSCHKAHGNQNPFGLIFLAQNATSVNEEGGWNAGQTQDLTQGVRNLCGQCHVQGN